MSQIEPYWGEFLIMPAAMEYSLNFCSHACSYCFANLNKPDRKGSAKTAINQIRDMGHRGTLADTLLREKYPVVISNKSDPFSKSNHAEVIPVIEMLCERDVPVNIQTKGGEGWEGVAKMLKPSVWYVSIGFTDDAMRKKVEPAAPSLESRWEMIEMLGVMGHHVIIGINPCDPEWFADPEPFVDRMAATKGVHGAWIEVLHFNPKQIAVMPERSKKAITIERIENCKKRTPASDTWAHVLYVRSLVKEAGLEAFTMQQPEVSHIWDPFHVCYPKTFPTVQEWINAVDESGFADRGDGHPRLISFGDWLDWLKVQGTVGSPMPSGKLDVGHYIGSQAHDICRQYGNWTNRMTYEQLMWFLWKHQNIKLSPWEPSCFAQAVYVNSKGEYTAINDPEHDLPMMVYVGEANSEFYYHYPKD